MGNPNPSGVPTTWTALLAEWHTHNVTHPGHRECDYTTFFVTRRALPEPPPEDMPIRRPDTTTSLEQPAKPSVSVVPNTTSTGERSKRTDVAETPPVQTLAHRHARPPFSNNRTPLHAANRGGIAPAALASQAYPASSPSAPSKGYPKQNSAYPRPADGTRPGRTVHAPTNTAAPLPEVHVSPVAPPVADAAGARPQLLPSSEVNSSRPVAPSWGGWLKQTVKQVILG
jgi:hypothetical protein